MFKFLKKIFKNLFKKEDKEKPESLFLKILEEERNIVVKKGFLGLNGIDNNINGIDNNINGKD